MAVGEQLLRADDGRWAYEDGCVVGLSTWDLFTMRVLSGKLLDVSVVLII